jgi:hypothetical protein
MTRYILICIFLITSLDQWCYSQNISNNKELLDLVSQNGQVEVTIPYPGRNSIDQLTRKVSIISVNNKSVLISLSPLTVDWFIQQNYNYLIIKRTDSKGIISAFNTNQAMEWDKYPTYTQYDSIMSKFVSLYPNLCHLDTIGSSIKGKLVFALKISDNADQDEEEAEVFYTSTMHGDETGGFVLMLRLADYLLKNYNLDPGVKNLVDNLEIWINPLANPDGTYKNGISISTSSTRFNANGVDLNRNFPDPEAPNTVQQKETADMIKFMKSHKFVLSANFHAGAEVVNYPWDKWLYIYHPDNSWFNNISRIYADTVHKYSGPAYMTDFDNGVTRGAVWYVVYGGRQDYVTYELHGREVTIELDNTITTPSALLSVLWQNNWHSLIGYLENALYGIHGNVKNSETSAPVKAKVFISGHDKDSSFVYSDSVSGNFIRLIAPGSWNLTLTSSGYKDTTIRNVVVLSGQMTELTAFMAPVKEIDKVYPEAPILYPSPAISRLNTLFPREVSGQVNALIFSQSGVLVADYNLEVTLGVPVSIDLKNLAAGTYTVVFTINLTKVSYRGRFIILK